MDGGDRDRGGDAVGDTGKQRGFDRVRMVAGIAPRATLQQRIDQDRLELSPDGIVQPAVDEVDVGHVDVGDVGVTEQVGSGEQCPAAGVWIDRLDGESIDNLHSRDHTTRPVEVPKALTKSKTFAPIG